MNTTQLGRLRDELCTCVDYAQFLLQGFLYKHERDWWHAELRRLHNILAEIEIAIAEKGK